jgi:hypothetical protein
VAEERLLDLLKHAQKSVHLGRAQLTVESVDSPIRFIPAVQAAFLAKALRALIDLGAQAPAPVKQYLSECVCSSSRPRSSACLVD